MIADTGKQLLEKLMGRDSSAWMPVAYLLTPVFLGQMFGARSRRVLAR